MVTKSTCTILGNFFGYMIQFFLGVFALATLLVKWYRETPRRKFRTWFRDAAKQAISALVAHGWNVLFAMWLKTSTEDPCTFYMVNYLIDNIFGIPLNYLMVLFSEHIGRKHNIPWLRSGDYGHDAKPDNRIWAFQLLVWIVIISAVKFALLFALIRPLKNRLYVIGDTCLGPLEKYSKLELFVVMICIPLVFNIFAFWVQDNFLMADTKHDADNEDESLVGNDTIETAITGGERQRGNSTVSYHQLENSAAL